MHDGRAAVQGGHRREGLRVPYPGRVLRRRLGAAVHQKGRPAPVAAGDTAREHGSESSVADMGMEPRENLVPESSVGKMGMALPENQLALEGSKVTVAIGLDLNLPPPHTIGAASTSVDAAEAAKPNYPPLQMLQLF
ncbi:hypothetical protein ABZP36_025928 [Zizania latifolia]